MDKFLVRCTYNEDHQIDGPGDAVEPKETDDTNISKIPFKYLFNESYECKSLKDNKTIALCQNCSKKVCASTSSSSMTF